MTRIQVLLEEEKKMKETLWSSHLTSSIYWHYVFVHLLYFDQVVARVDMLKTNFSFTFLIPHTPLLQLYYNWYTCKCSVVVLGPRICLVISVCVCVCVLYVTAIWWQICHNSIKTRSNANEGIVLFSFSTCRTFIAK